MTRDRVAEAFAAVPRADYLPPHLRHHAEHDGPLQIGHGQTSSQPRTVAAMLRLLEVPRGARVLDVGSGSGWTTALLAHLAAPDGEVHGVEIVPELTRWGGDNLAAARVRGVHNHQARPGELGWPDEAPYDRILVSADGGDLPQQLVDQLAVPGRMVIPVAGRMVVLDRDEQGVRRTSHGHYRFVPLV